MKQCTEDWTETGQKRIRLFGKKWNLKGNEGQVSAAFSISKWKGCSGKSD